MTSQDFTRNIYILDLLHLAVTFIFFVTFGNMSQKVIRLALLAMLYILGTLDVC